MSKWPLSLPPIAAPRLIRFPARTGPNVGDGDRHLLVALVVQRTDVVGRTDLLYCRANLCEAILGLHGVLPQWNPDRILPQTPGGVSLRRV